MRLIETIRAGRGMLAIALLAPFLIGGNHCLIGAFDQGTRMRCLEVIPTSAPAADQGCCHGASSAKDETPAPASSCCILVGPVPTDVDASAHAPFDACDLPLQQVVHEATSTLRAWPAAAVPEAPEPPPGTPHTSRAPPLS